jgi:hypothetical protein
MTTEERKGCRVKWLLSIGGRDSGNGSPRPSWYSSYVRSYTGRVTARHWAPGHQSRSDVLLAGAAGPGTFCGPESLILAKDTQKPDGMR